MRGSLVVALLATLVAASADAIPVDWTCTSVLCQTTTLGCFKDNNFARVLPGRNLTSSGMTWFACQSFCNAQNATYAGVEFGTQCFCGDAAPPAAAAAPLADCQAMACGGNASQPCGAAERILAFHVESCQAVPITHPYCNSTLPIATRVADLVSRLPLATKVGCLDTNNCVLDSYGLPLMPGLYGESLHGLRFPCARDILPGGQPVCATSFPHAQLLAASFNRSQFTAVGAAIGTEARAFFNAFRLGQTSESAHALSFFAPDLNLCRDPRWGRCLEVPGEDPFLTGEYGTHYVRALQVPDAHGFRQAAANVKHVFFYDVEHGTDHTGAAYDRGSFDAGVTSQDVVETYLPHFEAGVRGGGLMGAMCSYNAETYGAYTNVPSCANNHMLNGVMRQTFNFSGLVVSDCGAIDGIQNQHHYTSTDNATCRAALAGGCDINCGQYFSQHLVDAVQDGTVDPQLVDRALTRVLTQAFELGIAEQSNNKPYADVPVAAIDSAAHRQLALDAARDGMVLLKNAGGLLPLRKNVRLAVLGPHFNSSTELLANYYGENVLVADHTPLLALRRRSDVHVAGYAEGCELSGNDTSGIAAAAALAKSADVAVVFLGLRSTQGAQVNNTPAMEREGFDRSVLTLPGMQLQLAQAVAATGTPTVVVLINSGGLAATWVYDNIPAVLEAFYPGELGGDAIASVLMGDVSPSGRLPTSIYSAAYAAARNITDMEMRPHGAVPGVTHRFLNGSDGSLLFRFGYGRSYTTFAVTPASPTALTTTTTALKSQWDAFYTPAGVVGLPVATVNVANNGTLYPGAFVVLGFAYARDLPDAPVRQLFGFERLHALAPGATEKVTLAIAPQALAQVDDKGVQTLVPGVWDLRVGGEPDGFADFVLTVTGEPQEVFRLYSD